MGLSVTITWSYKPTDYFEDPYKGTFEDVELKIFDGSIEATVDAILYDSDPGLSARLKQHIIGLFDGIKLMSHSPYEIRTGAIERERPDGGRDIVIIPSAACAVAMAGKVNVKLIDKDGNVIHDSRAERIRSRMLVAQAIATKKGTDDTLDAILDSYSRAVDDPDDELIHLFEIREALAKHFGGKTEALAAIEVSSNRNSTLGRLANHEPLNQGRHRGKKAPNLRDATTEELEEARSIARDMILGYLEFIQ